MLKLKSILLSRYFIGVLLLIAIFSTLLNRTAINGFVDRCDGYNYIANGIAFTKTGREFINPNFNTYEDFQKAPTDYKFSQIPYPNKLFSLLTTKTAVETEFLYPAQTSWLAISSVTLGLLALWLLLIQASNIQIATLSIYFVFLNKSVIQFYGRPLSDPFAWSLIAASILIYLSSRSWGRWVSAVVLGVAFAFRLQSFFVLISQVIYEVANCRRKLQSKKQAMINIAILIGASYAIFKLIVYGIETTYYTTLTESKGDFGYYMRWASDAFTNIKLDESIDYVTANMKAIFAAFPVAIIGSLYLPEEYKDNLSIRFLRWFTFSGFIMPVLFYSISPGFDIRYLIYSVPVMTFLTTLNIVTILKRFAPRITTLATTAALFLVLAHMVRMTLGAPAILDSDRVTQYFSTRLPLVTFQTPAEKDVILTNKALTGAIFKNFNLVRIPPLKNFLKGDNSNVSAVIILFDMGCSSDPNFNPLDYMNYAHLEDEHHNIFVRDVRFENTNREVIVYFNQKYLPKAN